MGELNHFFPDRINWRNGHPTGSLNSYIKVLTSSLPSPVLSLWIFVGFLMQKATNASRFQFPLWLIWQQLPNLHELCISDSICGLAMFLRASIALNSLNFLPLRLPRQLQLTASQINLDFKLSDPSTWCHNFRRLFLIIYSMPLNQRSYDTPEIDAKLVDNRTAQNKSSRFELLNLC